MAFYGGWDSGATYEIGAMVIWSSVCYVAIFHGTGKDPSVYTSFWTAVGAVP